MLNKYNKVVQRNKLLSYFNLIIYDVIEENRNVLFNINLGQHTSIIKKERKIIEEIKEKFYNYKQ